MFEGSNKTSYKPSIKVIGIGGAGCIVVEHILPHDIEGIDFICANTDIQSLHNCKAQTQLQLGSAITNGLGAGADPETGRQAALEDRDRIEEILQGADMVFIIAGMGGGTGTGAAPVVAQVAKDLGILSVAVVTKPFGFEGNKRMEIAEQGMEDLRKYVDSLITIPNEKLNTMLGNELSLLNAFKAVNDLIMHVIQGITELFTHPGLINVDFDDIKTLMTESRGALIGLGEAFGNNRAREATEQAIHSPWLEDADLSDFERILVNITAGLDLAISEFDEVGSTISEYAGEDAMVVVGTIMDPDMQNNMRVTIIATGLEETKDMEFQLKVHSNNDILPESDRRIPYKPAVPHSKKSGPKTDITNSIKLVAQDSSEDSELAEIIHHLSNVYKSIGGDELIVNSAHKTPPGTTKKSEVDLTPKRRTL
ncbi:MAG: cell division protein FtsZ [Candidatus Thiodiazotropha taylori]